MCQRGTINLLLFLLVLGLAGCTASLRNQSWPDPRPLGREFPTYRPPYRTPSPPSLPPEVEEPTGVITLPQALSLALMRNPELAAFSWEVRAQEAKTLQAGLLANPQLSFDMEDFAGSGAFSGTRRSQATLQLGQLIELGGKRARRVRFASLTGDLAGWDYETKRIAVLTKASRAFIEVLHGQERLRLTQSVVDLAKEVLNTVSERVRAGKVSPIEETRANAALSFARIELERAKRNLEAARKQLATTWGSIEARFEKTEGELDSVPPSIPPLEGLLQRLKHNPELARWAAEISRRQASLEMEKTKRIPDITISAGYRRLQETDDNALVLGLTVPLPLFHRNQGAILEERYRLAKSEVERRAAEVRVMASLNEAYRQFSTSHAEVTALKAEALPAAQSAFDAISDGYRLGRFSYLELLDAQRTLFEGRERFLQALADYHKGGANLEQLIGEPLFGSREKLP